MSTPYLLRSRWLAFFPLILITIGLLLFQGVFSALIIVVVFLIWILSHHLNLGFYGLALLAPMAEWEISFSNYSFLFQDYPRLLNINAPAIDFWIILLGLAFAWHVLRERSQGIEMPLLAPGLGFFLLFLASAVMSLTHLPVYEISAGVKYIARYLLMFYFGYLVLGINLCRDTQVWKRGLQIFATVGTVAAVLGFLSLLMGAWSQSGFYRAVPIGILGFAPFGYRHILLAEVLLPTVAILIYLWHTEADQMRRKWLGYTVFFVAVIALLTLSRAVWLVFGVSTMLFILLSYQVYKDQFQLLLQKFSWALYLLLPLVAYVTIFTFTHPSVESSNDARSYLTSIGLNLWQQFPVIGQGTGSFITRLSEVEIFRIQFGEALDAHGIVQKLLAEQGVLGLITFLLLILAFLRPVLSKYRGYQHDAVRGPMYLLGFFLVFMPVLFQFFSTHYYASTMWVPILFGVLTLSLWPESSRPGFLRARPQSRIIKTKL